ncbi:MAG: CPBP family intramembrane glutamic endopeptidase [Pseudomonadota bacterium]
MSLTETDRARPSATWLWIEFTALFVGVPILMAVFFGSYRLFSVIFALALIAAVLLHLTPGFRWRELRRGPVLGEWRLILAFAALVSVVCVSVALILVPDRFLSLVENNFPLWIMIMVAYPIASALPQELIYRPLFFRRYGHLFPSTEWAIAANAAAFGFGHLFYMNPITIAMTAFGGAIMAWAYTRNQSFLLAWVLHAIAGQIVFTAGLGVFFYHGAIPQ